MTEVLSATERQRCSRFHFARDRHLYAASHALLRLSLSQLSGYPAHSWQFVTTTFGKPLLQSPVVDWHFNLSHSPGLAAVLIAREPCGVDVEAVRAMDDLAGMANLVLHPDEQAWMWADATLAEQRFFELWVLKEAYLKGLGVGLGGAPRTFSFACPLEPQPRLTAGMDAATWYFDHWQETTGHHLAIARQTLRPLQLTRTWPNAT